MLLRKGPLTVNIDVNIPYTFKLADRAPFVVRDLDRTIQIPGLLKVAEPFVVYLFGKENRPILAEKRYARSKPKQQDIPPILAANRASARGAICSGFRSDLK